MAKEIVDKPFGLRKLGIIGDFFIENDLDKNLEEKDRKYNFYYLDDLAKQIERNNKYFPIVRLKLKEIMEFDEELFNYIKTEPEKAIDDIHEVLMNKVKDFGDVSKYLTLSQCIFEKIHITFDLEGIKWNIAKFDNFSLGTRPYDFKLTKIWARLSDLKLFREKIAVKLKFRCFYGHTFDGIQFKDVKGKYRIPKFCIEKGCKAKNRSDFDIIGIEDYYEMGTFRVSDLDFSKQLEKTCYTFLNYDYFAEKMENINLNDIIEIIGIFKNDYSEVGTRKENQKIHEYIKVIDFNPIELKNTDPAIIKELYTKFEENRNYHIEMLDSIHPLTKGIYTFQIFKILTLLGIISSDSWNTFTKNRCSINSIVGSVPAYFKGSIVDAFREIIGVNNVGRFSGVDSTGKSLIPTSQRGKENDLQIRYGAFAYNNRRFLPIDEAQYILRSDDLAKPIKYLEDGYIDRGSDGTVLFAECKLSVQFLMNYLNEHGYEGYDYTAPLGENLRGVRGSVLQRIDLHYTMNSLPSLLFDVIERRMFRKNDGDFEVNKLYNWIMELKRIFPLQKISLEMENKLVQYIKLLRLTRGEKKKNVREFRTLIRLVCGISAMRMKTEVDETDLQYLQKHLVNLMIPFFDYPEIRELKLENIDMNEIFQNTFKLITEIKDIISLTDHINLLRGFLECHYFPHEFSFSKKLDKYMPKRFNLENNPYRKLYENQDNRDFISKIGYIIAKYKLSVHYVKRTWYREFLLKEIKEAIELEDEPVELQWIKEELYLDYTCDDETFEEIINELIECGDLIKLKNDLINAK